MHRFDLVNHFPSAGNWTPLTACAFRCRVALREASSPCSVPGRDTSASGLFVHSTLVSPEARHGGAVESSLRIITSNLLIYKVLVVALNVIGGGWEYTSANHALSHSCVRIRRLLHRLGGGFPLRETAVITVWSHGRHFSHRLMLYPCRGA